MSDSTSIEVRIEAFKKSVDAASSAVQSWTAAKREGADATVGSQHLSAYYESIIPNRTKSV